MTAMRSGIVSDSRLLCPDCSPWGNLTRIPARGQGPFYPCGRGGTRLRSSARKLCSMWPSGFHAQSQDVWPKQAWATQRPLLADFRRLRAHTGYSILDPCVLKRVRMGYVRDTDADPRQGETVFQANRLGSERLTPGRVEML